MRLPPDATLVIIDVQEAIADAGWAGRNNPDAEAAIAELLAEWRAAQLPVVHVRRDSPEPHSPYRVGGAGHAFRAAAMPIAGEIVTGRPATSAFVGTDLDAELTEMGRTTLVVCGIPTHGSVEATVRHAGDLGYRVFVVADACAALQRRNGKGPLWSADDVHAASLANMGGDYARVVDTATARAAAQATAMHPWKGSRGRRGVAPRAAFD